ncbi:FkbM family methyltransferase [Amphibacillus sp. Q70]|uniref:FkbM family methyltransferase n=1 Tax=Amphibacillus sp. Q70 TaxID=3453416 RepID=UPI003F82D838
MELLNEKKIILFGASQGGIQAYESLLNRGLDIAYFIDNDKNKWETKVLDKSVLAPAVIKREKKDSYIILITTEFINEVSTQLRNMGLIVNQDFFGTTGELRDSPILIKNDPTGILINLSDRRGLWLVTKQNKNQQNLNTFWTKAVNEFNPDIVIDVGVNYGEALFATKYNKDTKIIGIEANPNLIKYIEYSKTLHPNADQFEIVNAIASFEKKDNHDFYIDRSWSGKSGVLKASQKNSEDYDHLKIESITIDELISTTNIPGEKVLFKIDVEGFEFEVLRGMSKIIQCGKDILGYVEIDNQFLREQKVNIENYVTFLTRYFRVSILSDQKCVKLTKESLLELLKRNEKLHTDLILNKL